MATDQPGGLKKPTVFEQAEAILADQEKNAAHVSVVKQGDQVGLEAGADRELGRGWSLKGWIRWLRGEKQPTIVGGVEKRW